MSSRPTTTAFSLRKAAVSSSKINSTAARHHVISSRRSVVTSVTSNMFDKNETIMSSNRANSPKTEMLGNSYSPPLLLLEGRSPLQLFPGNISRTVYVDKTEACDNENNPSANNWMLEEIYNLDTDRKKFILRRADMKYDVNYQKHEILLGGPSSSILGLDLQELELKNLFDKVGTGATVWESSIAMAFYFMNNRRNLSGKAIELGCGLGLGSILVLRYLSSLQNGFHYHNQTCSQHQQDLESITLTDANPYVMQQCKANLEASFEDRGSDNRNPAIYMRELDWNKALCADMKGTFDTVIASDVVYLFPDIKPIVSTVVNLLSPLGKFHCFAPLNRSTLPALISELKSWNMKVDTEILNVDYMRLSTTDDKNIPRPASTTFISDIFSGSTVKECKFGFTFASKDDYRFLHITASLMDDTDNDVNKQLSLCEID